MSEKKISALAIYPSSQSLETATKDAQQQSEVSIHVTPFWPITTVMGQNGYQAQWQKLSQG